MYYRQGLSKVCEKNDKKKNGDLVNFTKALKKKLFRRLLIWKGCSQ